MKQNNPGHFSLKVCILTIGNEILKGKTINTNLAHIGRTLTFSGYEVYRSIVVRDDPEEIEWGINTALESSDLVVTSGGLGPTFDDMTVECVSKSLGIPTEINKEALHELEEKYSGRNLELTEDRLKMVRLPVGSKALHNPVGSAPGVLMEHNGKKILILPGVPGEMKAILESVLDMIRIPGKVYYEESFPIEGLMESAFAQLSNKAMKKWAGNVYIKSHPQNSEVKSPVLEIEVSSVDHDQESAKKTVREVIKFLKENYRDYIGK